MSSDDLAVQVPALDAIRTGCPMLVAKKDRTFRAAAGHLPPSNYKVTGTISPLARLVQAVVVPPRHQEKVNGVYASLVVADVVNDPAGRRKLSVREAKRNVMNGKNLPSVAREA
jgi:hypothetical protein